MFGPNASADGATKPIEVVASTTETLLNTTIAHRPSTHQIHHFLDTVTADEIFFCLAIPVLLYFVLRNIRNAGLPAKNEDDGLDWNAAWLTLDWAALYGLFRLSHDDGWQNTPFSRSKNVQQHWTDPHRPWLRRLLSMGIMPLYIQDGGLDLHYVNFSRFEWRKEFPYFALPRYQQAKQRAYIEFLVPFCSIDARMEQFIQRIIDNRVDDEDFRENNFAVMLRYSPPVKGGRLFYSEQNPPLPEDRPFTIGAQSGIKWLLPFLPDEILRPGLADGILKEGRKDIGPSLALYVKGPHGSKVLLLERTKSILVRVEAQHYGVCELDAYLYAVAQDAGLAVQWPAEDCQRAAEEELEARNLPIGGPAKRRTVSTWSLWSLLYG